MREEAGERRVPLTVCWQKPQEGARRAAAEGGAARPRAARTAGPAKPGARRAPSDGAPARLLRQPNRYDFSAVARFSEEKRIVFEQ